MKKIISLILCAAMTAYGCFAVSAAESETEEAVTEAMTETEESESSEPVAAAAESSAQTEKETAAETSAAETNAETEPETAPETEAETKSETEEETVQETEAETKEETEEETEEETKAPADAKKFVLYYKENHLELYGDLEGTVVMPEKVEAAEKSFITVSAPQYDEPLYSVKGSKVYKMTFEGYNTSSVGDGTHYDAGDSIAVKEDTVLYAIWTYELVRGQIIINANTVAPSDAKAPTTDDFKISVKGDSETAKLMIFDREGEIREEEDVSLPADLVLHDGESAVLDVLPGSYSLMREATENYAFEPDSQAAQFAEETNGITVTSLNESVVDLVYYYIEPLGEITVSRNGADSTALFTIEGVSETNSDIGFTFVIPEGEDSVTITELPAGDYVITYGQNWSVCFIPDAGAAECSIESMGDESVCEFELTFVTVNWLYSDIYVSDPIGKSKK